ncbi:uncharacterized protein BDV17DRAFT_274573 [Aspergillus undulatus]|uniref:uncharacterized protein n=1 Tax=Aspergillus undulatus TaxID=1810928 RepID=UPI003CCDCD4F
MEKPHSGLPPSKIEFGLCRTISLALLALMRGLFGRTCCLQLYGWSGSHRRQRTLTREIA